MATYLEYIKLQDFGCFRHDECGHVTEHMQIECESGDTTTVSSFSFPYPVGLLGGSIPAQSDIVTGDVGNAYMREISSTVTLAGDIEIGDSPIPLAFSSTPLAIWGGCTMKVGSNVYDIVSYDSTTSIATISGTVLADASSGTSVEIRYCYLKNIKLYNSTAYIFGHRTFGCRMFPPSMEIVIEYKHKVQLLLDKTIDFELVYYTGTIDA